MKINLKEVEFKDHPKYPGVRIGFIVTKERHPELSITLLEIEPEIEIPIHHHPREVDTIFVLSGEGLAFIDGKEISLKAEDVLVIPPGVKHGLKNSGKDLLRCFIVHTPALW